MLIDDTARCSFVGGRQRRRGVDDVVIVHHLQLGRCVSRDHGVDGKKKLRLAPIEIGKRLDEDCVVLLLLSDRCGRWMLARAGEIHAVRRAVDLRQALGSAAHRTDLIAYCRARTSCLSRSAERTKHSRALLYNPRKITESSSERALHCPAQTFREGVPVWAKRCFDRSRPSRTSKSSWTERSCIRGSSPTSSPRSTLSTF